MPSDQRADRLRKLELLRELGLEPYQRPSPPRLSIEQVRRRFEQDPPLEDQVVQVAGRMIRFRPHGKTTFADLQDSTSKIQLYFRRDTMGQETYQPVRGLDLGDILTVSGSLFKTKTGEPTIQVRTFEVLTKALQPMPEKWHGLQDVETRYRQRYLDLIANEESRQLFRRRSEGLKEVRHFLNERGFLEVETPMMQPLAGGAAARPFITHHNALDLNLYLRVAPELYLKRLLVGGFEKLYELNRNFRNEGLSPQHNPEFTMLELYEAYSDYNGMMALAEELIHHLAQKLVGSSLVPWGEGTLDLSPPYPRRPYRELFEEKLGFAFEDEARCREAARQAEIEVEKRPAHAIANALFEKRVEPDLIEPTFVIDYPTPLSPLARRKPQDASTAERFELFVSSMELANAFSELTDPIDQRQRFEAQLRDRDEGMERLDEDFLLALEHGMPPAGGMGLGLDRLIMVLVNRPSIREVVLFPLLRPADSS